MSRVGVAIIGSGNIGTDLLMKVLRTSKRLEAVALVGIEPASDGLARARRLGVLAIDSGLEALMNRPEFDRVQIVFDATSARAHSRHHELLAGHGKQLIDLTPAALGPYTVPVVNLDEHLDAPNLNMVTCGGQATIPIVAAISDVAKVHYAEIVASIASKSAGPGTRANIDEFTQTTARGLEQVGRAARAKAIIILNPAEPPMIMRDTVFTLSEGAEESRVRGSVEAMIARVQRYVPGYRLKQSIQFEHSRGQRPWHIPGYGDFHGLKTTVLLQVEGAAHYLPAYAGNLDIMTSAALATGERIAELAGVPA
ncbi:MAG TPA: acetaldehyde dehydrogenase (acetylating) [Steroidobacteraceae bacterium]|jgi:acetaldehyde dehydrogenase|nr:acetaldehyde dehydrogenase (acetylating) [Steroidobacteraceae bacterium]